MKKGIIKYAESKDFGKPAHLHRLAEVFAFCLHS